MATFVAGQPYTGKVIDPSQGGAIVDYKPSIGNTSQAQQQQQSGVQLAPITPAALETRQPVQPTVAQPIATPTVPDFLTLTQQEKQAQDQYAGLSQSTADLLGQLAGRDAYTTGQQQQQDIIGKQSAVNNYQNQLKALQQEATGINLNSAQQQQEIQAAAQAGGANVTKGGLSPQYQAVKTQNTRALLDNAVKQYSVGAQLSAAQGDLTSALNYVDQAVKLKYQPIEAQLAAQQANLQAIQNSPYFTSAQKKQAAAQELQVQQYLQNVASEKKNYQDTQDAIIQTTHNNPVIKPYTDPATGKTYTSQQIQAAISAAQSPAEVAQLVNYFGLSSLSQQEKFNQDLQTAKFKQDEKQFGMNYALQQQKFEQDKLQFGLNYAQEQAKIEQANAQLKTAGISATTGKPLTEGERKAQGYAERAAEADAIIKKLESNFTGISSYAGELLPNIAKSAERQQFEQAKRNFVNAILRPESGAVINPDEFKNADKQYFAQPGDSPEVVAQKQANRNTKIESLKQEGGMVIDKNTQKVISNGKEWIVGQVYNDGTADWIVDANGNWKKV